MQRINVGLLIALNSCGQVSPHASELKGPKKGRIVSVADKTFTNYAFNDATHNFGKGYWEGFISFEAQAQKPECTNKGQIHYSESELDEICKLYLHTSRFEIRDSTDQKWTESDTYKNLSLPVYLQLPKANQYYKEMHRVVDITAVVDLKSVFYQITKTNTIPAFSFNDKADQSITLGKKGDDIPGVQLSFSAHLKLFNNFAAGTDCSRVVIEGKDLNVVLDADHPSASMVNAIAPVEFKVSPRCQSSRIASPEHNDHDFELSISEIILGDPV